MKKSWRADNLSDLEVIAKELLSTAKEYKVFCFKGDLGAGKTTFIKTICKQLGVVDDVTSPTFSIVNEYMTVQNEPVYHFDFYRLKKEEEALDLGYEQYFFSSYYWFVEWPEKIAGMLAFPKATIFLTGEPSSSRLIRCSGE